MVSVSGSGLLADQPHAQHIHYPEEEEGAATIEGTCPTTADDADGNGVIGTVEGQPAYGMIRASLTTDGDASPESALAVERFPTAPGGEESYERTFTVPEGFDAAEDLTESVIVVHGIDVNDNGEYDMDGLGASDLNADIPAEATTPVLCGALGPAADGGVPSSVGGTNGIENSALLLAGAGSIAAAVGSGRLLPPQGSAGVTPPVSPHGPDRGIGHDLVPGPRVEPAGRHRSTRSHPAGAPATRPAGLGRDLGSVGRTQSSAVGGGRAVRPAITRRLRTCARGSGSQCPPGSGRTARIVAEVRDPRRAGSAGPSADPEHQCDQRSSGPGTR